ncbi:PhzF family phenazine biosynthesis protein [Candidatus Bathyarchaeota archaeon]|nr:PhzF family phenazine biosynthesis protein [Candidatus Bathyarchaeota archaeon]
MKKDSNNRIPLYIVDAFTDKPFGGNPAAVCLLPHEYADSVLQSIAAEMNLSETAFLLPLDGEPLKESKTFSLRWFTPKVEVPLCGHATLATAAVLFYDLHILADEASFETKSGILVAKKDKRGILLDFPTDNPVPIKPDRALLEATGIADFKNVEYARRLKKLLVHISDEEALKSLRPNFELMKSLPAKEEILGVIVTSHGRPPYDFVSRFFAPWLGINEDPVTGAAHTILTPYWSKKLAKKEMLAYQASARGGKLMVRLRPNNRVDLVGTAVIILKGKLYL